MAEEPRQQQYSLNIIGCGHVGRVLARLLAKQTGVLIGDVLNTSLDSGQSAIDFIGCGRAIATLDDMQRADVYLLGCPDNLITACAEQLRYSGLLVAGDTVFHCSGALSSLLLAGLKEQGVFTASLHPVKSFAAPALAMTSFAGTYCGIEGDPQAVALLEQWTVALDGIPFKVETEQKALYHAASVMACNYLVVLQEMSVQAFAQAGVERALAMQILPPLVTGTVDNVFQLGTVDALTGPIARGDYQVVEAQLAALQDWQPASAASYCVLGLQALELARQQGRVSDEALKRLEALLSSWPAGQAQ